MVVQDTELAVQPGREVAGFGNERVAESTQSNQM